jgi:hypothetical protein
MYWTNLPSGRWEDMLVALIPTTFYDFPRMGLVFLFRSVSEQPHIIVNVKVEQGPRLAARLVNYKVVKCVVLTNEGELRIGGRVKRTAHTCGIMRSSCK